MRNWAEMDAGDWHTAGTQLDMLAGIEGDGYGTLDLLDAAAEAEHAAEVAEFVERADGALFGLDIAAPTGDGALFSLVAAA